MRDALTRTIEHYIENDDIMVTETNSYYKKWRMKNLIKIRSARGWKMKQFRDEE